MKIKFKRSIAALTGLLMTFSAVSGINQIGGNIEKVNAASAVPAFPGAVGGGKYATGGRGGEVVHVTNLNDSGEGSFREAVSKPNRIVVFDVSGTIELEGNIIVSSNVTIAGQTAPGGSGITLKNYKLGMGGDNIICRYISSRPGPYKATSSGNDAWGGAKGANSIIDHCSMGWTTDEQWGLYSNNEYYTVQYSVIGPADSWGGHSKGIHGFGLMMGNGYLTFDHNLIVHNVSRNFRGKVPGTKTADFTNNVIYNWAYQTAYGTIGHLNYVGNTLKMGNGTTGGLNYVHLDSTTSPENFKIYLTGNRLLNKDGSVNAGITYNNWAGITYKDGLGKNEANTKSTEPFATMVNGENVSTAMTAESAEDSYEHVITFAGNGISPDLRTDIDKQVAYETRTGTGDLSGTASYYDADSSQKANLDKYHIRCDAKYSYPAPVLTKTIKDTDNDGMPDEWELARGLDPNDPNDTNGDYCGQGYTNIEYYINDLTVDSFPKGVVTLSPELKDIEPATPVDGQLIKDLIIKDTANKNAWYLSENTSVGSKIFGDRDYTYISFPDEISGAESIITACGSKNTSGDLAEFTAGDDIVTYIALDSRVSPPPSWLDEWEKTDMTCASSNDVTFELYKKHFTAGEKVTLGTNSTIKNCVNYCVFAVKDAATPSQRPLYDINGDDSVDSSDILILMKHLLGISELDAEQLAKADADENGTVNIVDLIIIKEYLLSI